MSLRRTCYCVNENSRSLTCYIFKSYLFFLTRYSRFRLRFFLFVRVCAAEPRPDFRYRSNANDGKAKLCRVLTRGLAPNKKEQAKPAVFSNHICFFLRDTAVSAFDSFCLSVYTRRSLGRIFAVAQMRTTAKQSFAAYSLEDSLQTKKNRQNLLYFQIVFVFLRDTAVSAFNSFGFIRICTAEPRPDFRCRSNANDGKA